MNQVTTQPAKGLTLRDRIESPAFIETVAKTLPKHIKADRFIRVAVTALTRIPKLAQCDQRSFFKALIDLSALRSFFKALIDLSAYGLEPDGRLAHLIPFENRKAGIIECQLIIDYKGLAELALRSGMIARLHADVVCDNDEFEYDCGAVKRHRIEFKNTRGNWYAAYAIAETKDGSMFSQAMTKDEIHAIRDNSQGYKAAKRFGAQSPWDTNETEMAKKTVFRRLSKWLPLSPEFRDAVAREDEEENSSSIREAKTVEHFDLPDQNPFALEEGSTSKEEAPADASANP